MKSIKTLTFAVVLAASCAQTIAAVGFGDLDRPAWRLQSGGTYQHWTFPTNSLIVSANDPYAADEVTNNFGSGTTQIPTAQPYLNKTGGGSGWTNQSVTFQFTNIWDLGTWASTTGAKTNGTIREIIPVPANQLGAYTYVWSQVLQAKGSSTAYKSWLTATNANVGIPSTAVVLGTNTTDTGVTLGSIAGTWQVHRIFSKVTSGPAAANVISAVTNAIYSTTAGLAVKELIVDTLTINPSHANITIANGANVNYGAPAGIPASTAGVFTWNQTCTPYDTGSRFPAGTTAQITCTVVDQFSGSVAYSFWVTNTETSGTAPTVTACSGGSVALADSCSKLMPDLTAGVTWTAGTPAASLVQTPAAGTVLKAGVYAVSFTATNIIGGAACSTTYTVSGAQPVAPPMALGAVADTAQKLDIAKLGIQAGPDGRSASFFDVFLATSAGGTAVSNNNQIVYTPALHYLGADSMIYRVVDCGGVWATNTITITVGHAAQSLNMIGVSDNASGGKLITARGIPTITYHLQQTDSLNGVPAWTTVTDQVTGGTADSHGIIYFTNKAASASSGYYRTTYP